MFTQRVGGVALASTPPGYPRPAPYIVYPMQADRQPKFDSYDGGTEGRYHASQPKNGKSSDCEHAS
jgi:hypothetical protein